MIIRNYSYINYHAIYGVDWIKSSTQALAELVPIIGEFTAINFG